MNYMPSLLCHCFPASKYFKTVACLLKFLPANASAVNVVIRDNVRYLEPAVDRSMKEFFSSLPSVYPHPASTDRNTKIGKSLKTNNLPVS